jgi:hypothetical protein
MGALYTLFSWITLIITSSCSACCVLYSMLHSKQKMIHCVWQFERQLEHNTMAYQRCVFVQMTIIWKRKCHPRGQKGRSLSSWVFPLFSQSHCCALWSISPSVSLKWLVLLLCTRLCFLWSKSPFFLHHPCMSLFLPLLHEQRPENWTRLLSVNIHQRSKKADLCVCVCVWCVCVCARTQRVHP